MTWLGSIARQPVCDQVLDDLFGLKSSMACLRSSARCPGWVEELEGLSGLKCSIDSQGGLKRSTDHWGSGA